VETSTVFISYAHGDGRYQDRILAFADRLELLGLSVVFDQYEPNPTQGWNKWMLDGIRRSDFVLCICDAAYHARVNEDQPWGTGLGAQWEGTVLYNLLQSEPEQRRKVQVLQFDILRAEDVPLPIRDRSRFVVREIDLENDDQFRALYRVLTKQTIQPPIRGAIVQLPDRDQPTQEALQVLPAKERSETPRSGVNSADLQLRMAIVTSEGSERAGDKGRTRLKPGNTPLPQRLARQKYKDAVAAYYDQRYADVLGLANEAKNLDGTIAGADLLIADVHFDSGQWDQALSIYEALGDNITSLSQWHIFQCYATHYHTSRDTSWLDRIKELAEKPNVNINAAGVYLHVLDTVGERARAKSLLKSVFLERDRNENFLRILAIFEWHDGNFQECAKLLEEAAAIADSDQMTWACLGVARAELRRFGLAIEALRKALEIRPRYQFALFALAEIYALMGDAEAAIHPLRKLVANRYFELPRLLTERTFDPIRENVLFKEFLASVPRNLLESTAR